MTTPPIAPLSPPETVYKTPFVELEETLVRFPNGTVGRYARLNPGTHGGVAIPLLVENGVEYLGLVRQYRHSISDHTLEFPRGGTEDESEEEAIRELVEETGLEVTLGRGAKLGKLYADTGILASTITVWLVPVDSRGDTSFLEDETLASHFWVTHKEFATLIRDGDLVCGISLAAYSMLQAFKRGSKAL